MGFFEKIKAGLARTKENIGHSFDQLFAGELNDDFYDELEETLILSDMGVDTALEVSETLRRRAKEEKIKSAQEARRALREILTDLLTVGDGDLALDKPPAVCLFIGVNGVGKTTTIGKLAARLKGDGRRVLMAAGDTFRAAADQAGALRKFVDPRDDLHGAQLIIFSSVDAGHVKFLLTAGCPARWFWFRSGPPRISPARRA